MGRLETLTLLFCLGATAPGALADPPAEPGSVSTAAPDQSVIAPAESTAGASAQPAQSEPPVPPRRYLEVGARLYNRGRYPEAAKYLKAAQLYRDRLSEKEQVVLDAYREKSDEQVRRLDAPSLVKSNDEPKVGEVGSAEPGSNVFDEIIGARENPISALAADPEAPLSPTRVGTAMPSGTGSWRDTTDTKQKARWLLQLAREQIVKGHLDVAAQVLREARSMGVDWGFFDDNPDKVAETLEQAQASHVQRQDPAVRRAVQRSGDTTTRTVDRRTAKARLREARAALNAGALEQAEAIAREVMAWDVNLLLFDDSPAKVMSAVMAAKRKVESAQGSETAPGVFPGDGPQGPLSGALPSAYLKGTRLAKPETAPGALDLPR